MRNLSIVTLLVILALTAWTQQAQAPVEITSEPSHHKVVDNPFVRVFAVSVDPGKSTLTATAMTIFLSRSVMLRS